MQAILPAEDRTMNMDPLAPAKPEPSIYLDGYRVR